jgi:hypothetical protein
MFRIFFRVLFVFSLSFFLSSCDFYTLYFIKKTLSGDFDFVKETENKYKLKGSSYYDIPVSEEEKILPEFVEDKVSLLETEKDLFPLSKEKPSEVSNIFVSSGEKISISLPKANEGIWLIKKYPIKISELLPNSEKSGVYTFKVNSSGTDNAIFQLIDKKGNILSTVEYKISSLQGKNTDQNVQTQLSSNIAKTNVFDSNTNSSVSIVSKSNKQNTNDFDVIDEEKSTNVVEPSPPSSPGKLDIKSLVGNETKYFDYIDNIAKKYGYYRAISEIESIETNVSDADLPKLKLKKIEYLEKLGKYDAALGEAEAISSKEPFGKLYVGIFLGAAGKRESSEKNIKEALQSMVSSLDTKNALKKVLEFYLSDKEPPTKDIINFLVQKNELIQKDFVKDYYSNLLTIGNLYERAGEYYKAKSVYDFVFNNGDEESKNAAETNINKVNQILDYK